MKLGEKLGESTGSEVYAFGPGRIIKLARPGTPRAVVDHEVRVTSAVRASGAPAPEVFGTEVIDGRAGIILSRYDGRSLLQHLLEGETTPPDAGATLASVHAALHRPRYRAAGLWSFREFVAFMGRELHERGVPPDVIARSREIADELPEDVVLCHGDLHFANVLMTGAGPRIIDWISAMRAIPLVDVARQHLTLAVFMFPEKYERLSREAEASFIQTYAALTGTTEPALRTAIVPYATVMGAMRLAETSCSERERAMLVEYVRGR